MCVGHQCVAKANWCDKQKNQYTYVLTINNINMKVKIFGSLLVNHARTAEWIWM